MINLTPSKEQPQISSILNLSKNSPTSSKVRARVRVRVRHRNYVRIRIRIR